MQKPLTILLTILTFFTPLLFWTLTPNFFSTPKQLLLILTVVIILLTWTIQILRTKTIHFTTTRLTYPLIIFILALIIHLSTLKEATTEALIGKGSLYLASATLALFISSFKNKSHHLTTTILTSFLTSTTLLAIHSILQLTFLHNLTALPTYMQTRAFSLASSPVIALSLFIIGITTAIIWASHTRSTQPRTLLLTFTAIQTISLVAYISLMVSGGELLPHFLPLTASWSIMLDAFKNARQLFLGVGLANFSAFYTQVKPLFLNSTIFWNILPTSATNELLTLITTGGLLLTLPLLALFSTSLHSLTRSTSFTPLKTTLIITLIIFLFTPGSTIITILLFILLALATQPQNTHSISLPNPTSRLLILTINLSLSILTLFFTSKVVLAENHLRQSQLALNNQDGQKVYEQHLKAISLIPKLTNYHLSYSQVNLTLAASLSQQKDLTEDQRKQVTQLLSQAVREGKTAVSLRPSLASTWSNLGFIYRQLINVADGADQLAIQNYAQATTLDPANAPLRVELGGIFYQLDSSTKDKKLASNYLQRAVEEFTTATQIKPDYANAWYNLSKAYELANNTELAYQAMQQAIASLNPDSPDLNQATEELSALKAKLPKPTPSPTPSSTTKAKELTTPSPLPSPISGEPLNLNATPSTQIN